AIMEDQQILLLDEPFNALDDKSHEKMIDLIAKLQKDGKTILITSHNKDDLDKLCTKFFIVKDEKIVPYDNK
ncbi:MAG: multidrug ABC transporter ATP-binding protein, partial [Oscillospiraceae bacterium]